MDKEFTEVDSKKVWEVAPGITDQQLSAIPVILDSSSVNELCKKLGISRTTYYDWLKNEDFKSELKEQRMRVVREALDRLKCAMTKAADELVRLLDSPRDVVRRLACQNIIEYGLKSIELEELEQRLEKVERVAFERRTYAER